MIPAGNRFVLVAEDRAHLFLAATLADRVAVSCHAWLQDFLDPEREDLLDPALRCWQADLGDMAPSFLKWKDVPRVCAQQQIPRRHGLGLGLQRRSAEMALRLLRASAPVPTAVVLLCDSDRHDWRSVRESLDQGRGGAWPFPVAIGVCRPEAEAWLLTAFVPRSADEVQRHLALVSELGLDPCEHAELLASGRDHHARSAKRVLAVLLEADAAHRDPASAAAHPRARQGLREMDFTALHARGQGTGLRAFLDELRLHLAPCYGPPSLTAPQPART